MPVPQSLQFERDTANGFDKRATPRFFISTSLELFQLRLERRQRLKLNAQRFEGGARGSDVCEITLDALDFAFRRRAIVVDDADLRRERLREIALELKRCPSRRELVEREPRRRAPFLRRGRVFARDA
ncbi:MAG TPA: hypothetical protein VGM44_00780 [Polyangiaceae bacterium]